MWGRAMNKPLSKHSTLKKKAAPKKPQSKKTSLKNTRPALKRVVIKAKKAHKKISPSLTVKKSIRYLYEDDPFLKGKKKK